MGKGLQKCGRRAVAAAIAAELGKLLYEELLCEGHALGVVALAGRVAALLGQTQTAEGHAAPLPQALVQTELEPVLPWWQPQGQ